MKELVESALKDCSNSYNNNARAVALAVAFPPRAMRKRLKSGGIKDHVARGGGRAWDRGYYI